MQDCIVTTYSDEMEDAVERARKVIPKLTLDHITWEDHCHIYNYDNLSYRAKHVSEEQAIAILNHIAEFGVNEID